MSRRCRPVADETTEAKPLRRDAELNLARILVAARDVFAEHGYEASMEQIAARAEVGIGTLYRRFPNKADLCAAVVDAATERTRQIADEVLRGGPGDAVFEFVRRCVDAPSCWRAATEAPPWRSTGTGLDCWRRCSARSWPGASGRARCGPTWPSPTSWSGCSRSGPSPMCATPPGATAFVALPRADARRVPPRCPRRAGASRPHRGPARPSAAAALEVGRRAAVARFARPVSSRAQLPRMPSCSSRTPWARDSAKCSSHSRISSLPVSSAQRRGMAGNE